MDEMELKRWRMRMNIPTSAAPTSAANTGFISSRELDEPREQFEARYRKEIAMRDSRE